MPKFVKLLVLAAMSVTAGVLPVGGAAAGAAGAGTRPAAHGSTTYSLASTAIGLSVPYRMSLLLTKSANIYAPLSIYLNRTSASGHHPGQSTSVTFALLPAGDAHFTSNLSSVSISTKSDLNEPDAQFGLANLHLTGGSVKTVPLKCGKVTIGSQTTRTGHLVGTLNLTIGSYFKVHETSIPATATKDVMNGKVCKGGGGTPTASCDQYETLFSNVFDTKTDLDWAFNFTRALPKGETSLDVSTGLIYGAANVTTGITVVAPRGLVINKSLGATVTAAVASPFATGTANYKGGKVSRVTHKSCQLASSTDKYVSGQVNVHTDLFGTVSFTASTATVQVQTKL